MKQSAGIPDAPDAGEAPEDDAPPEAEGEPTEGPASAEEATEGEEDEPPPFPAYTGRTVQAPVTIVDDWGKPLSVLTVPDVAVEVRSPSTWLYDIGPKKRRPSRAVALPKSIPASPRQGSIANLSTVAMRKLGSSR